VLSAAEHASLRALSVDTWLGKVQTDSTVEKMPSSSQSGAMMESQLTEPAACAATAASINFFEAAIRLLLSASTLGTSRFH
tara:strand:+ start:884 stop:1126 length:243 start_codon:yes stop_codon:yes gene_type:complete